MDGLQHGELPLHQGVEALGVADEEVAVPVVLAEHGPGSRHPGPQALVHLGLDGAAPRVAPGLHHLLVVVQDEYGHHQAACLEGGLEGLGLGHVHEIGRDHLHRARLLGGHAACGAVDLTGVRAHLHREPGGALLRGLAGV